MGKVLIILTICLLVGVAMASPPRRGLRRREQTPVKDSGDEVSTEASETMDKVESVEHSKADLLPKRKFKFTKNRKAAEVVKDPSET
uniref:Uncharacterized protein n=1 Tax=Megaselia scalaris TaxID=36166 RepID=T1H0W6_MEGSC